MPHFLQSGLPEPLLQMLASEAEIHRKVGMWVWTDMVDNCADAAALYAAQIVPPMLASADMGQSADVRTAAAAENVLGIFGRADGSGCGKHFEHFCILN